MNFIKWNGNYTIREHDLPKKAKTNVHANYHNKKVMAYR